MCVCGTGRQHSWSSFLSAPLDQLVGTLRPSAVDPLSPLPAHSRFLRALCDASFTESGEWGGEAF